MRLARTERVGPITYRRLIRIYGSATAALAALPGLARNGGGAPIKPLSKDLASREFDRADAVGARILFVDGPDYPALLGMLDDAPAVLAVLGDPAHLIATAVAIVGSRKASANGHTIAYGLAEQLGAAKITVVSGLARGIDTAAHEGALRTGSTIAAVAGGLDKPYPAENTALQARIAEGGAVVAEAPFGTAPQARHFPRRNRIIAGLSLGVVVVEAARRSGSLITARLALGIGRELFAVPGSPMDANCHGSNDLIRQGAHLTETAQDILANLPDHPLRQGLQRVPLFAHPLPEGSPPPHMAEPDDPWSGPPGSPAELARTRAELDTLLSHSPTSVDDLVAHCQVSPAAINILLLEMELAGRVSYHPGQRVALIGRTPLADRHED